MQSITEIQDSIIEDFSLFDEWDEKYTYLIELGRKLEALPEEFKKDDFLIRGCQSKVWMHSSLQNGKVYYQAESDALIVKGLVYLLIKTFSGQSPETVVHTEPYFIEKIGMNQHLSMTRSNGLASMVKQMKLHALAYQSKV